MAMGKRQRRARHASMWIPTGVLPRGAAHPFYQRLNSILDDAGFDAFVEAQCAKFYAPVSRDAPPGNNAANYAVRTLAGATRSTSPDRVRASFDPTAAVTCPAP